jgi:hypothetical protein
VITTLLNARQADTTKLTAMAWVTFSLLFDQET